MRKTLLYLLLLLPMWLSAQQTIITQQNPVASSPSSPTYNRQTFKYANTQTTLTQIIPIFTTPTFNNSTPQDGAIGISTIDSAFYFYLRGVWRKAGSGGGSDSLYVTSDFGGNGTISSPLYLNTDTIRGGYVLVKNPITGALGHDTSQYLPNSVMSGLGMTATEPSVFIASGTWRIHSTMYATTITTTLPIDAQDATLSRYDEVYADNANTLHIVSGALSSAPVPPAIPVGTVDVGSVLITPTTVTTLPLPPITDYVNLTTNQTGINGSKTWTGSQVYTNQVIKYTNLANATSDDFIGQSNHDLLLNSAGQAKVVPLYRTGFYVGTTTTAGGFTEFCTLSDNVVGVPTSNFINISITGDTGNDNYFDYYQFPLNEFTSTSTLNTWYTVKPFNSLTNVFSPNRFVLEVARISTNRVYALRLRNVSGGTINKAIIWVEANPFFTIAPISITGNDTNVLTVLEGAQITISNNNIYDATNTAFAKMGGAGIGTVTNVSSIDGNLTVSNPTTTPVLTVISAPKWLTARNLAGNSVDGSANVAFSNKFIVQGTTDAGLSGAQFLGALGTGLVKNTTTTGVLSIATANTDYLPVASPVMTGTPTVPTATTGTNTTQAASTAFVNASITEAGVPTAANPSGLLTFTVANGSAPTFLRSDGLHAIDSTVVRPVSNSYSLSGMQTKLNNYALLASPAFTGTPTTPTAAAGTSTTQIASTAFVSAAAGQPTRFNQSSGQLSGGDSYTTGTGPTVVANDYAVKLSVYTTTTLTNIALSGSGAWNAVKSFNTSESIGHNNTGTLMVGLNDVRRNAAATATLNKITNAFKGVFANHMLDTMFVAGTSARVTRTGTWSTTYTASTFGGKNATGASSSTSGDVISCRFYGNNVVLAMIGADGTLYNYGTASVSIDGVTQTSLTYNGQTDGISDGVNDNGRSPYVLFYTGLGDGTHTITVTNTSSSLINVDYFGTLKTPSNSNPLVFFTVPRMNATGYAAAPANASDAVIATTNTAITSMYNSLPSGYPVYLVNTDKYLNLTTDQAVDGIHRNDLGHLHIFQSAYEALGALQNNTGLMTLTGAQTVTGVKTFGANILFNAASTYDVGSLTIPAAHIFSAQFHAGGGNLIFNGTSSAITYFFQSASTTFAEFFATTHELILQPAGGTFTSTPSSIFTATSTTKGSIPAPLMTTTQQNAISSPAKGLQIFDNVLNAPAWYNGTAWLNPVDLSTTQTIGGVKSFSSAPLPSTTNAVPFGSSSFTWQKGWFNAISSSSSSALTISTPGAASMIFQTNGQTNQTLFSTGNLLVQSGGTQTDSTAYKFSVTGRARISQFAAASTNDSLMAFNPTTHGLRMTKLVAGSGIGLTYASGNITVATANTPLMAASADLTAQSAAGNVTTFTVGASTATFNVSGYINITAVTVDVIELQCTYTDENNTAQTANFFTQGATSALLSAIGNSAYPPMLIRAKNGTVITVKTTLTTGTGSIQFDTGSRIQQL